MVRHRLRFVLPFAVLAVLMPAPAPAAEAKTPRARAAAVVACPAAAAMPSAETNAVIERTVLCLLNRERARQDLPPLRVDSRLAAAAERHSRDMVRRGFFDHTAPGGVTLADRIRASGYLRGSRFVRFGENLAWGTHQLAAPAEIVAAWMRSPGHRRNILRRGFSEVGIGIALGAPGRDDPGATYTTTFGDRR